MQTVPITESVQITLSNSDMRLVHTRLRKMGWFLKTLPKSEIENGLDDIRKGNVYHSKKQTILNFGQGIMYVYFIQIKSRDIKMIYRLNVKCIN